jgi:hypothetical protein
MTEEPSRNRRYRNLCLAGPVPPSRYALAALHAVAPVDSRLVAPAGAAVDAVLRRFLTSRPVLAGLEPVGTGAAPERVPASATDEAVIAYTAVEHVVASAAVHEIATPLAKEPVAARVAGQHVVASAAVE